MNNPVRVTVVVENTARDEGLASEHGLAIHIRRGNTTGLLDTGASDAVITNAATLGIDLTALDWVALSHGHYDHAGGLMAVLEQATDARLYLHKDALSRHVAVTEDGGRRFIGVPFGEQDLLDVAGPRLRWLNGPIELVPGVWVTGPIPQTVDFEELSSRYAVERSSGACSTDLFRDDQSVVIETASGIVVILGCAHAGVLNTLRYVDLFSRARPIHAVIGGMHLLRASAERIKATLEAFVALGVEVVVPGHCTGNEAVQAFQDYYGPRCLSCSAGSVLEF